MLLQIENVLSTDECRAIVDATKDPQLWDDGRATAKGGAKAVKSNLQAVTNAPAIKGATATILEALKCNDIFQAAALVDDYIRPTLNRYDTGMRYGDHVDAPYIHGKRTDLSFTLFLEEPDNYEGGELVIDNAGHEDRVKGAAGSLVLYPSWAVHRVEEVKSGSRLCCIGWVRSRVRSAEKRSILFELETVLADLRVAGAPMATYNRLLNIRNNLLRAFGE